MSHSSQHNARVSLAKAHADASERTPKALLERIERLERAVYEMSKVVHGLPWDSCTFLGCDKDVREIEKEVRKNEQS